MILGFARKGWGQGIVSTYILGVSKHVSTFDNLSLSCYLDLTFLSFKDTGTPQKETFILNVNSELISSKVMECVYFHVTNESARNKTQWITDFVQLSWPVNCKQTIIFAIFTHCGLVTPYGIRDLGQHWFRQWLNKCWLIIEVRWQFYRRLINHQIMEISL